MVHIRVPHRLAFDIAISNYKSTKAVKIFLMITRWWWIEIYILINSDFKFKKMIEILKFNILLSKLG